jgi:hypothetical protein
VTKDVENVTKKLVKIVTMDGILKTEDVIDVTMNVPHVLNPENVTNVRLNVKLVNT